MSSIGYFRYWMVMHWVEVVTSFFCSAASCSALSSAFRRFWVSSWARRLAVWAASMAVLLFCFSIAMMDLNADSDALASSDLR